MDDKNEYRVVGLAQLSTPAATPASARPDEGVDKLSPRGERNFTGNGTLPLPSKAAIYERVGEGFVASTQGYRVQLQPA